VSLRVYCFDDLERIYDDPERVARLVGRCRDRPAESLLVGGGDDTALGSLAALAQSEAIGGSLPPEYDHGRGLARPAFAALEHAAEVPGNHDLDPGLDWTRRWAERVPPAYCCRNLAADAFRDAAVFERGGARVGVVGVTHPKIDELIPVGLGTTATDPVAAARRGLADLRERGVDYTVVLSHCGTDDTRVARETDADAVVGGHVHEHRTGVLDGTPLLRPGGPDALLSARLDGPPDICRHPIADAPVHEPTLERYRNLRTRLGGDERVATLAEPVERDQRHRLGGESRVGNFLADALRTAVDADAALFPAGLRDGPPLVGEVTLADVISLCPFDDTIHELRLRPDQLRRVLADCGRDHPGDPGWVHVHVAGLRVRWDADGSLRSVRRADGSPLEDELHVATTGWFVLTDGYDPANESHLVDDSVSMLGAVADHARDGGLAVETEGRIAKEE